MNNFIPLEILKIAKSLLADNPLLNFLSTKGNVQEIKYKEKNGYFLTLSKLSNYYFILVNKNYQLISYGLFFPINYSAQYYRASDIIPLIYVEGSSVGYFGLEQTINSISEKNVKVIPSNDALYKLLNQSKTMRKSLITNITNELSENHVKESLEYIYSLPKEIIFWDSESKIEYEYKSNKEDDLKRYSYNMGKLKGIIDVVALKRHVVKGSLKSFATYFSLKFESSFVKDGKMEDSTQEFINSDSSLAWQVASGFEKYFKHFDYFVFIHGEKEYKESFHKIKDAYNKLKIIYQEIITKMKIDTSSTL